MSRLTHAQHLQELQRSLTMLGSIAAEDLDLPVPTCPGWKLRDLFGHLGRVHRMGLAVISTGAMIPASPKDLAPVPEGNDEIRDYFLSSSATLLHDLEVTDPTSPCWTFLGTGDTVSFWSRRMANEHAVHLFDAQRALDPEAAPQTAARSACDAIDEYVIMVNARVLSKRPDFSLGGTLHLHATDDAEGEWMFSSAPGRLIAEGGHGKGDAAVRGTAAGLLLGAWGRLSLTTDARFERFGDDAVIANFAGIGGN